MITSLFYVIVAQKHVKAIKVHVNFIWAEKTLFHTLLLLKAKIVFIESNLTANGNMALKYFFVGIIAPKLKIIKYPHHTNIVLISTICAHIIVTLIQFFLNIIFLLAYLYEKGEKKSRVNKGLKELHRKLIETNTFQQKEAF